MATLRCFRVEKDGHIVTSVEARTPDEARTLACARLSLENLDGFILRGLYEHDSNWEISSFPLRQSRIPKP